MAFQTGRLPVPRGPTQTPYANRNPIMASHAKGKRPSSVVPKKAPKPIVEQKPPAARHCLFCKRGPANDLMASHLSPEPIVFCCMACAAAWALGTSHKLGIQWCRTCEAWTDTHGFCLACELDRGTVELSVTTPDAAAIAGTKAVQHG